MLVGEKARSVSPTAREYLSSLFRIQMSADNSDAIFLYGDDRMNAVGITGLKFSAPVLCRILADDHCARFLSPYTENGSVLFLLDRNRNDSVSALYHDGLYSHPLKLPAECRAVVEATVAEAESWGGRLNENGELICDLRSPSPGPNYYTNMLIGNRLATDRPLQSTPKSVTDRLGRGSFRSHANTQVLATRWDCCPEENGFPANRQFYLVENGKVIFYSADPQNESIEEATCSFGQNYTQIRYRLRDGLCVERTIFLLPYREKLPVAVEVQNVRIINRSAQKRDLRLVYTGMFGMANSDGLYGDVIYTTVVCQSEILRNRDGHIAAVNYSPNPSWDKGNIRFHAAIAHVGEKTVYPDEFCFRVSDFLDGGTWEQPRGAVRLNNTHSRKGPGFFALSTPLEIAAGETADADNFTGLVSYVGTAEYTDKTYAEQIGELCDAFVRHESTEQAFAEVKEFVGKYASFFQLDHSDSPFSVYVNRNLPFQVFYQTFVSRSFDQTQKGYREIGFREIQDLFASVYYFVGMGRADKVKELLAEWIENVYSMGYANHNFYWAGKEPGMCSDDALWLVQALERYIELTGDTAFLDQEFRTADGKTRTVYATVQAILVYSGSISVGRHGFPLIDRADWNDCLHVDAAIDGTEKERRYKEQLERTGESYGTPFESDYSESIMNAFLLRVALRGAEKMAGWLGKAEDETRYAAQGEKLAEALQTHAWKGQFFARVLFNRDNGGLTYLGANGDGLSAENGVDGTYFLNSFSWALLSDVATEEQIAVMLDTIDARLRTSVGFRLCSGVNFPKVAPGVDVALYYPGDRENGGVFKHANMMAVAAMFRAANMVESRELSARLTKTAWWVIDNVLPYNTLKKPFVTCGNPRFCTQYSNYETGESVGPTLSGTATWLLLSLLSAYGLTFDGEGIRMEPLLPEDQTEASYCCRFSDTLYRIRIQKPKGYSRKKNGYTLSLDGETVEGGRIPVLTDGKEHMVELKLEP